MPIVTTTIRCCNGRVFGNVQIVGKENMSQKSGKFKTKISKLSVMLLNCVNRYILKLFELLY